MHHELKIWPSFYEEVKSGRKPFDIRRNDRGFQKGDTITFREWDPDKAVAVTVELGVSLPPPSEDPRYTGRTFTRAVSYVLSGWGVQPEHVALGLAPGAPT